MSVESLAIALHHSRAAGTTKLVLIGIANHDGDGGSWPSVATLARYANVDVRTVQRSIKQLIALGEVERVINDGGTRQTPDHMRPNLYRVLLTCPADCDRTAAHRSKPPAPVVDNPVTPDLDRSNVPGADPLTSVSPPDASVTPPLTPVSPEPSFNHPVNINNNDTVNSPADERSICWHCGQPGSSTNPVRPVGKRSRQAYCIQCSNNGLDSPLINCVAVDQGCNTVGKRTMPGQQYHRCPDHQHMTARQPLLT